MHNQFLRRAQEPPKLLDLLLFTCLFAFVFVYDCICWCTFVLNWNVPHSTKQCKIDFQGGPRSPLKCWICCYVPVFSICICVCMCICICVCICVYMLMYICVEQCTINFRGGPKSPLRLIGHRWAMYAHTRPPSPTLPWLSFQILVKYSTNIGQIFVIYKANICQILAIWWPTYIGIDRQCIFQTFSGPTIPWLSFLIWVNYWHKN